MWSLQTHKKRIPSFGKEDRRIREVSTMSSGDNELNLEQIDLNTLRFQANTSVVKQALDVFALFKRRGGFESDDALVTAFLPVQAAQLDGRHTRELIKGDDGLNQAMQWCVSGMKKDAAQGITT